MFSLLAACSIPVVVHVFAFLLTKFFVNKTFRGLGLVISPPVLLLTSFSCALSITLPSLLVLEMTDINPQLRFWVCRIDFFFVLVLLHVVLPVGVVAVGLPEMRGRNLALTGGSIVVLAGIWKLLERSGEVIGVPPSGLWVSWADALARVGVLGATAMSVLGGLSAAQFLCSTRFFSVDIVLNDSKVKELEQRLELTLEALVSSRKIHSSNALEEGGDALGLTSRPPRDTQVSMASLRSRDVKIAEMMDRLAREEDDEMVRKDSHRAGLYLLARELQMSLKDVRDARDAQRVKNTAIGRLQLAFTNAMALYGVYRIAACAVTAVSSKVSMRDPVANAINWIVQTFSITADVNDWTPLISFSLLGILVVINIRSIAEKFQRLPALVLRSNIANSKTMANMLALLAAEGVALYFCACFLLCRIYLPASYRTTVTAALAENLNFEAFHLVADRVFLLASFVGIPIFVGFNAFHAKKIKGL